MSTNPIWINKDRINEVLLYNNIYMVMGLMVKANASKLCSQRDKIYQAGKTRLD